jgi:hypothetical protein
MARRLGGFLSDKRAITPVLSNLLLTVVAVAAMALATTATYVVTSDLRDKMSERVVVEDVWFSSASNSTGVYLRNVGKVAVRVSGVYVNHTSRYFTKPFYLEISEHRWLNISQGWVSGSMYYVDIVTIRGLHVGGYYKAPQTR